MCNHAQTAKARWVTPRGAVLVFKRGVLDTDEEGANVIRADPLYGRVILDGDPSATAHGEITPAAVAALPRANPVAEARYCSICDQTFASEVQHRRHMRKTHGEEG